jgi:hypothetical protein
VIEPTVSAAAVQGPKDNFDAMAAKLFNREPTMAEIFEKIEPLTPAKRIVLHADIQGDNRPLVLATCFAELCKLEKIGHCAAYRTDYAWSEDYQLWLPDIRRSLFRRIFLKHFGDQLENAMACDEPLGMGPGLITSVIDFARGMEGVALSPAEVALTPEPQLLSLDEMRRRPKPRFMARLGGSPII